jgi:hypothetical protein
MTPPQLDIITTGEAGRMIGRSARTVQRLIESGELATIGKLSGVNGHFLLDRAVVETLATKRSATAA